MKDALDTDAAETALHDNTRALFGPHPADRHVHIMVTAPEAAEVTRAWADRVLRAGANILRINAAHESPAEWQRIVEIVRARLDGTHWKRRLPTVALLSSAAIGESYLRPVDY